MTAASPAPSRTAAVREMFRTAPGIFTVGAVAVALVWIFTEAQKIYLERVATLCQQLVQPALLVAIVPWLVACHSVEVYALEPRTGAPVRDAQGEPVVCAKASFGGKGCAVAECGFDPEAGGYYASAVSDANGSAVTDNIWGGFWNALKWVGTLVPGARGPILQEMSDDAERLAGDSGCKGVLEERAPPPPPPAFEPARVA